MSSQPLALKRARPVSPLSSLSAIRAWCALALLRLAALASGGRKSTGTTHPPSFTTPTGSSTAIDSYSEGSLTAGNYGRCWIGRKSKGSNKVRRQVMSIDMLPDDVLLAIFDFCADEDSYAKKDIEAWQPLVHVCRRWRWIVFGSPRRLNLRLVCTAKTPVRDTLDVWPALPLLIQGRADLQEGLDNIVAVLEHSDRVRLIDLARVSSLDLETLLAAMQEPFPELIFLLLWSYGKEVVLPDSFLGGSVPRLQVLRLDGTPFPSLPKLLLTATHLVKLNLLNIPHSGYFSPKAMFTALSTLTSLEEFILGFQSPRSRPDQASRRPLPLPPTRSILSVLTFLWFKGDSEYLDDLVAHIDVPRLDKLNIFFFNQIVFDTPQFNQFICRTPRLKGLEKAHVIFMGNIAMIKLFSLTSGYEFLKVGISCRELDWQVSSLEKVCTSCLPPLSTLDDLYIYESLSSRLEWQDNIENALWLDLLHPFSAVKNLYLSEEFSLRIVPALQELAGDRATEVLPTLQNIFLEKLQPSGPIQEGVRQFVATRQVTSHSIAVSRWDRRQD